MTALVPPIKFTSNGAIAAIRTAFGEARSEQTIGEDAVFWAIRNRAWIPRRLWGGSDIYSVCHASAQFSCWSLADWNKANLEAMMDLRIGSDEWERLAAIFSEVMSGAVPDPTNHATYYYATATPSPFWAKGKTPSAVILHHTFFSMLPDGSPIPEEKWYEPQLS